MKKWLSILLAAVILCTVLFSANAAEMDIAQTGVTLYWPVPGHTSLSRNFWEHDQDAIDISDGSINGADVIAAIGGTVERIWLCSNNHMNSAVTANYGVPYVVPEYDQYGPACCWGNGHGLLIHGDDGRYYNYAHMQSGSIPTDRVYNGARVESGQYIGKVGCTGNATGPHLHFRISTAAFSGSVNPMDETYNYDGGGSGTKTGLDYGDDFYACIINSSGWKHIGQADNGNVEIMAENASTQNRIVWHFVKINSNNAYRIMSVYNGKYLDVDGAGDSDGTNLQCYPYHDNPAQEWYIQSPDGHLYLTAGCTSRVIDVQNSDPSIGTNVYMWSYNATNAQRLSIYKFDDKIGNNYGDDFYAMIKNKSTQKPIGHTDSNNIEVMTEKASNYNRTIWHFTRQNNRNAYRISTLDGKRYIDVDGAGDSDGTNLQTYVYHDNPAQIWYIQQRRNATALTSGCSSRYIDFTNGATSDGTNVQMWTYNNTSVQDFDIEIIDSTSVINYAISANKAKYDKGDTVTATISGTLPYVYNYKFHIVKPDGTEEVIDNQCNSILNYKPTADGVYTIFAEVKNPIYTYTGSVSNKAVSFRVGEEPTEPAENPLLGDVDGDEEVGVLDATYIQRYAAGFNTPYPIGEAIG